MPHERKDKNSSPQLPQNDGSREEPSLGSSARFANYKDQLTTELAKSNINRQQIDLLAKHLGQTNDDGLLDLVESINTGRLLPEDIGAPYLLKTAILGGFGTQTTREDVKLATLKGIVSAKSNLNSFEATRMRQNPGPTNQGYMTHITNILGSGKIKFNSPALIQTALQILGNDIFLPFPEPGQSNIVGVGTMASPDSRFFNLVGNLVISNPSQDVVDQAKPVFLKMLEFLKQKHKRLDDFVAHLPTIIGLEDIDAFPDKAILIEIEKHIDDLVESGQETQSTTYQDYIAKIKTANVTNNNIS